jgi:ferredoxin
MNEREARVVPAPGRSLEEDVVSEPLKVWVDQDLCTGDGLCVQYAPEVFEFDIDGLAYVKGADGELRTDAGSQVDVPQNRRLDVIDSAKECPGECIHVVRVTDGAAVAGPDAPA